MKETADTNNPRTLELFEIMKKHGLSVDDVAKLMGRKTQTVWSWRTPSSGRVIPKETLELLKIKVRKNAKSAER